MDAHQEMDMAGFPTEFDQAQRQCSKISTNASRSASSISGFKVFRRYLVTKTICNLRAYTACDADIIAVVLIVA